MALPIATLWWAVAGFVQQAQHALKGGVIGTASSQAAPWSWSWSAQVNHTCRRWDSRITVIHQHPHAFPFIVRPLGWSMASMRSRLARTSRSTCWALTAFPTGTVAVLKDGPPMGSAGTSPFGDIVRG